jgi:hypothetical protein
VGTILRHAAGGNSFVILFRFRKKYGISLRFAHFSATIGTANAIGMDDGWNHQSIEEEHGCGKYE